MSTKRNRSSLSFTFHGRPKGRLPTAEWVRSAVATAILALGACSSDKEPTTPPELQGLLLRYDDLVRQRSAALYAGEPETVEAAEAELERARAELTKDWGLSSDEVLEHSNAFSAPSPQDLREWEDEQLNQFALELAALLNKRLSAEAEGQAREAELLTYQIAGTQAAIEEHIYEVVRDSLSEDYEAAQEARHSLHEYEGR